MFVANRLLGGVGIGLASNLSPLYIAEIAPAAMRGKLVSINQLTIVIGILLAQVINWLIAEPVAPGATPEQILASWNGQVGWRWMFGVTAVPAFLFFAAMFFVPESPRWLAKSGDEARARAILDGPGARDTPTRPWPRSRRRSTAIADSAGDLRAVLDPRIRPAVMIGVVLAVFQQWCGINVIFNYAEEIFSSAGYGVSDILFNIVITGLVNLAFTFVAIGTVDRVGRKALMLVGSAGLAVIYTLIGLCYATGTQGTHLLLLVVAAIALYGCSLAPVTWVVLSEIFPNRVRGTAMALAVFALWAGCFTLTYTFPLLNQRFGPAGTFWIYAGICALGFVFILRRLPETKGKTLEEIEAQLESRSRPRSGVLDMRHRLDRLVLAAGLLVAVVVPARWWPRARRSLPPGPARRPGSTARRSSACGPARRSCSRSRPPASARSATRPGDCPRGSRWTRRPAGSPAGSIAPATTRSSSRSPTATAPPAARSGSPAARPSRSRPTWAGIAGTSGRTTSPTGSSATPPTRWPARG